MDSVWIPLIADGPRIADELLITVISDDLLNLFADDLFAWSADDLFAGSQDDG